MKNEITDEKLIALITGDQDEELIQEIARNPNLKKRFDEMTEVLQVMEQNQEAEVPVHIGANFEQAIWNEQNRKSFTFGSWQAAAAVVFIVAGFLLGRFTGQGGETVQNSELTSLKHEIQLLKEVTMASTLKQHSASERMMAVNQIEKSQTVNPVLVKTLINTFYLLEVNKLAER